MLIFVTFLRSKTAWMSASNSLAVLAATWSLLDNFNAAAVALANQSGPAHSAIASRGSSCPGHGR